ncbi:MAG: putative metal-binding motif-containing protein [Pseudomonadota bacterium]|nr:putative metal-binding motif-containing protein [Pseudomonadota bacterium]
MLRSILKLSPLAVVACASDIGITKQAQCDGVLQQQEETVDAPFDVDQDGAFDGANPDCAATYAAVDLDCDDADPDIRPGVVELQCNGVDDDCAAETPDGADVDADGYSACEDCADAEPGVNPGTLEVACNLVDDDCDEATPDGVDADGDGATACDDCNDSDAAVDPAGAEVACNGVDDDCDEATADGADVDGDGYSECEDCADAEPAVNPGTLEVACNLIDDDCDGATPDGVDADADGATACDDCNDANSAVRPGAIEVACNGVDDDCDPATLDEECGESDYTDTWNLDDVIEYSCTFGVVTIDFERVLITDAYPDVTVNALGSGAQPGEMDGTFSSSTEFSAEQIVRGSCTEVYAFAGTFTSMTTFEGTFTADFVGSGCFDCANQSWIVTGSR